MRKNKKVIGERNDLKSDKKYMAIAKRNALYSNCKKKHLGCLLLLSDGKYIYGWNGPPVKINPCIECPRLNFPKATNLEICRAVHAERRCLLKAAKMGYSTMDSILYSYMGVPCKDCMLELIEAGVKEIICIQKTYYDNLSKDILREWIKNGGKFRIVDDDEK